MWHENRTWTSNSLVFLESQYFHFNYLYYTNPRYHLINTNHQGVPTETSKAPKRENPTSTGQSNWRVVILSNFLHSPNLMGVPARGKIQQTRITNMLHVWVHYIIYHTSYEKILPTLLTPILKSTSEWLLPILISSHNLR